MITWLPLIHSFEKTKLEAFACKILQTPKHFWFHCNYRNCDILPLYSERGNHNRENMGTKDELDWTFPVNNLSDLKSFLQAHIFPLFKPIPRVMAIKTNPNDFTPTHYDCNSNNLYSNNFKVRLVLTGEVDTLYFETKKGKKYYIPPSHCFYLMDGSHPHGVKNGNSAKITLGFGSPWNDWKSGKMKAFVKASKQKYARHTIKRHQIGRPVNPDWFQRPSPPYTTYPK